METKTAQERGTKQIILTPKVMTPRLSNCLYAISVLACNAKEEKDRWFTSEQVAGWIHGDYRNMVDAHRKCLGFYLYADTQTEVPADFESRHEILSCTIAEHESFTQKQRDSIEATLFDASSDYTLVSRAREEQSFIANNLYFNGAEKQFWQSSLSQRAQMLRERKLDTVSRNAQGAYKLGGLGHDISDKLGAMVGGELALYFSLKPLTFTVRE